jgi:hypothetical protein
MCIINRLLQMDLLTILEDFDIIVPYTTWSSKWSLSFRFPHQNLQAPLLSLMRATCPSYLILLALNTKIIFGEQYRPRSLFKELKHGIRVDTRQFQVTGFCPRHSSDVHEPCHHLPCQESCPSLCREGVPWEKRHTCGHS